MFFMIVMVACAVAAIGFVFFSTAEEATEEIPVVSKVEREETQGKKAA